MRPRLLWSACVVMTMSLACSESGPVTYQGYVESEFVHVGSGVGGRLERLFVSRGQTVEAQAPLFDLESTQETAAVKHAANSAALLATEGGLLTGACLSPGRRV